MISLFFYIFFVISYFGFNTFFLIKVPDDLQPFNYFTYYYLLLFRILFYLPITLFKGS